MRRSGRTTVSEPTRGNKGTGQAPDQSKGVTGADGASANGQQNGRPDFVDGGQSTARTAAAAAREKTAKKPAPKAAPQGGGLTPRPQPPVSSGNQAPTARPQTPTNSSPNPNNSNNRPTPDSQGSVLRASARCGRDRDEGGLAD